MGVKDKFSNSKSWVETKISSLIEYNRRKPHLIYGVIAIIGVILIIQPFKEDSIIAYYKVRIKKYKLQKELELAQENYTRDSTKLSNLNNDVNALERIAREDFLMKSPNETIFIIKDSNSNK